MNSTWIRAKGTIWWFFNMNLWGACTPKQVVTTWTKQRTHRVKMIWMKTRAAGACRIPMEQARERRDEWMKNEVNERIFYGKIGGESRAKREKKTTFHQIETWFSSDGVRAHSRAPTRNIVKIWQWHFWLVMIKFPQEATFSVITFFFCWLMLLLAMNEHTQSLAAHHHK